MNYESVNSRVEYSEKSGRYKYLEDRDAFPYSSSIFDSQFWTRKFKVLVVFFRNPKILTAPFLTPRDPLKYAEATRFRFPSPMYPVCIYDQIRLDSEPPIRLGSIRSGLTSSAIFDDFHAGIGRGYLCNYKMPGILVRTSSSSATLLPWIAVPPHPLLIWYLHKKLVVQFS